MLETVYVDEKLDMGEWLAASPSASDSPRKRNQQNDSGPMAFKLSPSKSHQQNVVFNIIAVYVF